VNAKLPNTCIKYYENSLIGSLLETDTHADKVKHKGTIWLQIVTKATEVHCTEAGMEQSLIIREEHRVRVLRKIIGSKRVELTGGWREQRNEEFHNLYSSPVIIRMMKEYR
jgi:hypothetical protein